MKPPKTNQSIILCAVIVLALSCKNIVFSKEENAFVGNVSAMLNGAKVTLTKGVTASSGSGTSKEYEITISNLTIDSSRANTQLISAQSIPVLALLSAGIPNISSYRSVVVKVETGPGKEIETKYEMVQLKQVEDCLSALRGCIYGIQNANKDSIAFYTDPKGLDRAAIDTLITTIVKADSAYGKATDNAIQGFQIGTLHEQPVILFKVYLKRGNMNNLVDMAIDPVSKKVLLCSF